MSEPRPLNYEEIQEQAWKLVADGAQSYVEDALDEDGEFRPDDFARIRKEAEQIISGIRHREVFWT